MDLVHNMKLLSHQESLQLLRREALEQVSPEGEFIQLTRRVISYTEGLPLALKFIGSCWLEQSSIEWESSFMKLSTTLPPQIYNTLKLSFDSLHVNERVLSLNIVLLYVGEDMDDVIQKLDGSGCNAISGVRALLDRSLVTIVHNKLRMHNLLQIMGRQMIRQYSENELRSRGIGYMV